MANQDLTPWRRGSLTPLGFDPFQSFRREMDRLFDDFFAPAAEGRSFATPQAQAGAVWPKLDIEESDQAYTVTAELPGIAEKDIELNLAENALTISGEKRSERNEENAGRRYTERAFGRFQRTIPFPVEVDADKVQAACSDGVLTITLPKNAQAKDKTRKIEIQHAPANGGRTAAEKPAAAASGSGQ